MSRARAVQQSKDRLVANMIVALPVCVIAFFIWLHQKPKTVTSLEG